MGFVITDPAAALEDAIQRNRAIVQRLAVFEANRDPRLRELSPLLHSEYAVLEAPARAARAALDALVAAIGSHPVPRWD